MGMAILIFCMAMLLLYKIQQTSGKVETSAMWKVQNQRIVYVYEPEEEE